MTTPSSRFDKHDLVITPTGELAYVDAVLPDGWLGLRYKEPLPGAVPDFTLKAALVRKCVPGLRAPTPVRIK